MRRLVEILARRPDVIDERFAGIEHTQLRGVRFAVLGHRLVDGFVAGAGIDRAGFDRLDGGRVAAGIAELEILARDDADLFHGEVRHQMAAGRVDVAEGEALAL